MSFLRRFYDRGIFMNKKHLNKFLLSAIIIIGLVAVLSVPAFAEAMRPHTALDIAPPWAILAGILFYPIYILFWLIVNICTAIYQAFAQLIMFIGNLIQYIGTYLAYLFSLL